MINKKLRDQFVANYLEKLRKILNLYYVLNLMKTIIWLKDVIMEAEFSETDSKKKA